MINYKEIDRINFYDVCKLSESLTNQQRKCVADNDFSIAEASLFPNNAYCRAIYNDDELIGFMMLFIPNQESIKNGYDYFYLWRLMIANEHQNRGYGKIILEDIVDLAKEYGFYEIFTGVEMADGNAISFYKKFGYIETGETEENEKKLLYRIL